MAAKANIDSNVYPVKILVVSQNYEGYTELDGIKKNVEKLDSLYSRLQIRKSIDFRNRYIIDHFFKRSDSFEDLRADIISGQYDIIHFSLHSEEGTIFFSDSEQIPYSRFESLFNIKSNIKAVILNICESERMAVTISRYVEWVLGWSHKVIVDDAIKVSEQFYSSLFGDNSIEDSFRAVKADKSIRPVICKDSAQYNIYEFQEESDHEKDISREDHIKDIDINKDRRKKKLSIILISVGLILVLLIVPVNKILNPGAYDKRTFDNDSLRIVFPVSGSEVGREETLQIVAKLRSGGRPWIFILPPGGKEWWPQNRGILENDHWKFTVSFGNEIDSGRFRALALIIKDNIAADMQDWYRSQSTGIKSDPLSEELVRSFFWYETDTADYYRIHR